MNKIIGTVSAGNTPVWEVVDLEDGFNIQIRSIDDPEGGIKIAKQSSHIFAEILRKVDVK